MVKDVKSHQAKSLSRPFVPLNIVQFMTRVGNSCDRWVQEPMLADYGVREHGFHGACNKKSVPKGNRRGILLV
jgi:hypothetical protein